MSDKGIIDHESFLDGVKHPLGVLADACLNAFEENGNPLLEEAANALWAIETVDLSRCIKCENISPLPWRMNDDEDDESGLSAIDEPILDANGSAVVKTDSGCYPPELPVSEAIVDCMNTVYALKTKQA